MLRLTGLVGLGGVACLFDGAADYSQVEAPGLGIATASSSSGRELPTPEERAADFFQCDRQCRWHTYASVPEDFFNRDIIGRRSDDECECFNLGVPSEKRANVPYMSKKEFDTERTWSGGERDDGSKYGFNCNTVCIQNQQGELETVQKEAADSRTGIQQLHCGDCSTCSVPEDIKVLWDTKNWITEVMTKVSAKFAKPILLGGHHNATRLADDLQGVGITFSRTRRDGRADRPTCMDCWTDNIMCDAKACKSKCWIKFFDPGNKKTDISGKIPWYEFNAECLRCDEENCGPAFIKCAGANRRSAGIESDIARPEEQKCKHGMYTGKSGQGGSGIPTVEQPSSGYVNFVLNKLNNGVVIRAQDQKTYESMFGTHRCCCIAGVGGKQCWWFSKDKAGMSCPRILETEKDKWCYGASWFSRASLLTSEAADGEALCEASHDADFQFTGPKC